LRTDSAGRRDSGARGLGALVIRLTSDSTPEATPSFAESGFSRIVRQPGLVARGSWLVLLLVLSACRQDMHDQPKYQPLEASSFFGDLQASRSPVAGTVARGELNDDTLLYTGKVGGQDAALFPFPVDERLMARGQERYTIYCSPCHGQTGTGDGMIVRRGYRHPPSFADARLRDAPVGHFFDVMTNGFGAMPDYAAQIKAADRWAIVAYVRALQLSAHATLDDVPPAERGRLDEIRTAPPTARGAETERK
jgi:mono/diheme cytochrome c family protein